MNPDTKTRLHEIHADHTMHIQSRLDDAHRCLVQIDSALRSPAMSDSQLDKLRRASTMLEDLALNISGDIIKAERLAKQLHAGTV